MQGYLRCGYKADLSDVVSNVAIVSKSLIASQILVPLATP